jgi:hypothetical protein
MNDNPLLNLVKESIRLNAISLATLPGSIFLFFLFFSLETLLSVFNAKAMYLIGFILQILFSYGSGVLLFPRSEALQINPIASSGEEGIFGGVNINLLQTLKPFAEYTQVSVFACILGYTVAYWLNLNFLLKMKNIESASLVYMLALIIFLLFEIFVFQEEWQGLLMSLGLGIIFGIIWANLTYQQQFVSSKEIVNIPTSLERKGQSETKTATCDATSGNQNEDMICRAFRL